MPIGKKLVFPEKDLTWQAVKVFVCNKERANCFSSNGLVDGIDTDISIVS